MTFPYTISDGTNIDAANITVTITAAPIVATDDAYITAVDTPVAITPLVNDTTGATISEINGMALIDAGGNITFVPDAGYTGSAVFPYTIRDNNGNIATAYITITIASSVAPNRVPATSIWSLLMLIGLISLFARYYRLRR